MFTASGDIQQKPQITTKNAWKNIVFCIFWVKNQNMQKCFEFILKHFMRAFQCRFQNCKMCTASGDIQQKNPENDKKKSWKIQFFAFFGLKTKNFENISDLSEIIFRELFNSVFRFPKCLMHPEIFNKNPR